MEISFLNPNLLHIKILILKKLLGQLGDKFTFKIVLANIY